MKPLLLALAILAAACAPTSPQEGFSSEGAAIPAPAPEDPAWAACEATAPACAWPVYCDAWGAVEDPRCDGAADGSCRMTWLPVGFSCQEGDGPKHCRADGSCG